VASGAGSNLLDLQVGGSSKFKVDKDGVTTLFGAFNTCTLKISQSGETNGFGPYGSNAILAYANGARTMLLGYGGGFTDLRLTAAHRFGWTSDAFSAAAVLDAIIVRDAAGIIAQRNDLNGQTFRVYNSTDATPATNFDRATFGWTSNILRIGTENGGTYTTARAINFIVSGNVAMTLPVAGGATIQGLTVGRGGGASDRNSAFGVNALATNTTGLANVAIGTAAVYVCSTGDANTGIGEYALYLTNGSYNTGIGWHSLYGQMTGQKSTSIGSRAGEFISGGSTSLITVNQGVFLGADTKALADNSTNEIVIGYNVTGKGSNTSTVNNTSATLTKINGTSAHVLDVTGTIRLSPPASVTPANNGELMVEATSNTSLTLRLRGSDGVVRSVSLTLA
jgi:hypothetical protein